MKKGHELVERTPMNWGKNLTLLGAMRLTGWVLLSTMFDTTNKDRFLAWLVHKLLSRLNRGDTLVLDNLKAHHDARVKAWCKHFGVRLLYLPPYSHDFNPSSRDGASEAVRPRTPPALHFLPSGVRRVWGMQPTGMSFGDF